MLVLLTNATISLAFMEKFTFSKIGTCSYIKYIGKGVEIVIIITEAKTTIF